jgi:hypothetical protein
MKENRLRSLTPLDYMFAMVLSGTPLSVGDDGRCPPQRTPLAGVSIATFRPVFAGVLFLVPASAAAAVKFTAGLVGITKVPWRYQGFSSSGLTSTGSTARFSEKLGDQGGPILC